MNIYEIYKIKQGMLYPTGITARGYKIGHVEKEFEKAMRELACPCVITIKPFNHELQDGGSVRSNNE